MENHLQTNIQKKTNQWKSTLSGLKRETDEQTNQLTDESKDELTNKPINEHILKAGRSTITQLWLKMKFICETRGKPSTWLPRGELVEQIYMTVNQN